MKQKKMYAYLLCCLSVMNIQGASAQQNQRYVNKVPDKLPPVVSCERRAVLLNEYYNEQYIALEAKCYGEPAGGVVDSCKPQELSAECQEQYEALARESAQAFDDLYADCPDLPRPRPMPEGNTGSVENVAGPTFKAPSKVELLDQVKSLKKQLRRSQAKRRGSSGLSRK